MPIIRGRRIAPGYYEYIDKPSGLVWNLSFNDELIPPEWQASIGGGESDGAFRTKRDGVEAIVGWIDEIYDIYDEMTYEEVRDRRYYTFSDDFTKHIGQAILDYMDDEELDIFYRRDFGA